MKIGDLVKITYGTYDISVGTLAVVVQDSWPGMDLKPHPRSLYSLRLVGHPITRAVKFRAESLELVSESR